MDATKLADVLVTFLLFPCKLKKSFFILQSNSFRAFCFLANIIKADGVKAATIYQENSRWGNSAVSFFERC